MSIFEKITVGRSSKLQIIKETSLFILAREVSKDGEDKDYLDKNNVLIQRLHLIDKTLIRKRISMVIDKKYGELVQEKI
jgi:hypothetical protein